MRERGNRLSRRGVPKSGAAGVALAGLGVPAIAQGKKIKLGYVSPQTGPLAPFAEADNFVIGGIREAVKAGIKIGSGTQPVEIIVKDSQSNPNRAAEVASDLILKDQVDLMLVPGPATAGPSG